MWVADQETSRTGELVELRAVASSGVGGACGLIACLLVDFVNKSLCGVKTISPPRGTDDDGFVEVG